MLFTDREYRAWDPPRELKGKRMLRDSIDRSSFTCTAPGVVFVLTPARDRNRDSIVDALVKQGFEKVRMREFLLFGNIPGNIVTVYQKRLAKDETITFGKWGVGPVGTSGDPLNQGFDEFFGYNNQGRAHNYYPDYMWHNDEKVELDGKTYSHDLIVEKAFEFIRSNSGGPFFCYIFRKRQMGHQP